MDAVVNLNHGEILQEKFTYLKLGKVNSIFNHYTLLFMNNFFNS